MATPRAIHQWLQRQLPEWEKAGWVTPEGARAIRDTYQPEDTVDSRPGSTFTTVVSILGAALLGGGVILLFAYNWNTLGRGVRTLLSLLPLAAAQGVALFAVLRKAGSPAWREGCATGVVASVAAGIALIGQTYNIQGDLGSFLLTWMLLSAPLVFILRSRTAAYVLLFQFLAWLMNTRFLVERLPEAWLLFAGVLACTIWLQWAEKREMLVLNLFSTITATILLLVASGMELWYGWLLLLTGWLALLGSFGETFAHFHTGRGVSILGRTGLLMLFIASTYGGFWKGAYPGYDLDSLELDLIPLVVITILAAWMLATRWTRTGYTGRAVLAAPFIVAIGWVLAVYGQGAAVSAAMNLLVILYALGLVFLSWKAGSGGGLRAGFSLIAVLLLLRFFDYDFSLLTRGIAFIAVGSAFLGANFWLSRRTRRRPS
jgi:uncharacterized membrane protein